MGRNVADFGNQLGGGARLVERGQDGPAQSAHKHSFITKLKYGHTAQTTQTGTLAHLRTGTLAATPPSGDDLGARGSSAQSSMDGPMGYRPVPATCQISEIPPARFTVPRARKHTNTDAHSKGVKTLGLGCPIQATQGTQATQATQGSPGHPHVTSPLPLRLLTRARTHSSYRPGRLPLCMHIDPYTYSTV